MTDNKFPVDDFDENELFNQATSTPSNPSQAQPRNNYAGPVPNMQNHEHTEVQGQRFARPMQQEMIEDNEAQSLGARGPGMNEPVGSILSKYYREPGIHIPLPTGGAFMPKGSYQETLSGDIPVYPMRAADEMMLKTPDALMNGYAIEQMIRSCCPSIVSDYDQIPTPDLEVLMLAIRAATFGEIMEMEVECPNCGEHHEFNLDLPALLSTMKLIPAENTVRLNDQLVVYLRPYTIKNGTKISLAAFNETRKLQAATLQKIPDEERNKIINDGIARLTSLNLEMMSDCVLKIVTPNGTETDKKEIFAFITNSNANWTKMIDTKLQELNNLGIDKRQSVTCSACNHTWDTEVEFNPANFFETDS